MHSITKTYSMLDLCDDRDNINYRIKTIENITKNTICPIFFKQEYNQLVRNSTRIKIKKIEYGSLNYETNFKFSRYLDSIYNLGFIHGDLNKKNLHIDQNNNIIILDWEPSLSQIINHRFSLMGTQPFIDSQDVLQKKLTIRTDILCFFKIISNSNIKFFNSLKWFNLLNASLINKKPFDFILNYYYNKNNLK